MTRRTIAAVVTIGSLLTACGATGESPSATAAAGDATSADRSNGPSISGVARDASSRAPLAGVVVTAGEHTSTTASDGSYRLSVSSGTYTVSATHSGYQAATKKVTVPRRGTTTLDWALAPLACSYTYGSWGACQPDGTQTRTVASSSPAGCTGTPVLSQSCTYVPPVQACTYTYSSWSTCQSDGTQTRTVVSSSPAGCTGTPVLTGSCTYVPPSPTPTGTAFKVFANNDLGMHCVDSSFAVFSILPPYNVVDAQVVALQSTGKPVVLDHAQVDVRYSAVADATGSINSTSIGKSNFWQYVLPLYGAALPEGQGLQGMWMPREAPNQDAVTLQWDLSLGLFKAPGIPIFPVDDAGHVNRYPLMRFSAVDRSGKVLASSDVVLPVSEETSCQNCHATGKVAAPVGAQTWSTDTDLESQARRNVLILHNARTGTNLQAPVLCAACHYSPALDLAGTGPGGSQTAHKTMSSVMHAYHADKMAGLSDSPVPVGGTVPTATMQSCYQCHPGATTQCLRGAMTTKVDCQNCHGNMAAVGGQYPLLAGGSIDGTNDGKSRRPWLDVPRCSSCHANDATVKTTVTNAPPLAADGLRFNDAFRNGDASASPIVATNRRFAEETNKMFRKSKGHGGLACEACHGSTHAIWSANPNDNVAATQLQGHAGTIGECNTCHQAPPTNGLGGPHGMHPVGSAWVEAHHSDSFRSTTPVTACQPCHGADYRGTVLSKMFATRSLAGRTLTAGTIVGCYTCHNGPNPG
jgi:hypothetical protein